jgi:hypothetical protein
VNPGVASSTARNRGRKTILAETAPSRSAPGSANGSSSRRSQSGSGRASLLMRAANGVATSRRATLLPPANPSLLGLAMARTQGYRSASSSSDPSPEALSTTHTAICPSGRSWAASPSRQSGSRWAPFQFSTTTVTSGSATANKPS